MQDDKTKCQNGPIHQWALETTRDEVKKLINVKKEKKKEKKRIQQLKLNFLSIVSSYFQGQLNCSGTLISQRPNVSVESGYEITAKHEEQKA